MKSIAIVILNWNGKKLLEQFLQSVIENSNHPGAEVIVADNASTDDSVQFLQKEFPDIKIIQLEKNYGFAGGYNRALSQIDSDYYLLLNSDVLPEKNWIHALYSQLNDDDSLAVLMPKIRSYKNQNMFEYAGAAGGFIDKYGYPFCRGRIFDSTEQDFDQYNQSSEVFWASGASFLINAKLYKEFGGLDESFFAHMEEIDLCWRLKNRGYKIKYIPESIVYHVGGASLNQSHPYKTYLNFRNNLFLLFKNLPSGNFCITLFLRLLLDGIAAIKFIFSFEFGFFLAVLKSHFSFYKNLPRLVKQRKELLLTREVDNHPEMYNKSIVYDYFIKGKKRFSELDFHS